MALPTAPEEQPYSYPLQEAPGARQICPSPGHWPGRPIPRRSAGPISPDPHPLLRREIQLVAWCYAECTVPGVHVSDRAIHSEYGRAVRVAERQSAQTLVSVQLPPNLCPGEEEALIRTKTIQHRCSLPVQRNVIRLVGNTQPTQVTNVLAQRQPPIHLEPGERFIVVVLRGEAIHTLAECLIVF